MSRIITGIAVGAGASLLGGILFSTYLAALTAATVAEIVGRDGR